MTFEIFCARALEIAFFIGLGGCSVVVLLSWISILGSVFSTQEDVEASEAAQPRTKALGPN